MFYVKNLFTLSAADTCLKGFLSKQRNKRFYVYSTNLIGAAVSESVLKLKPKCTTTNIRWMHTPKFSKNRRMTHRK